MNLKQSSASVSVNTTCLTLIGAAPTFPCSWMWVRWGWSLSAQSRPPRRCGFSCSTPPPAPSSTPCCSRPPGTQTRWTLNTRWSCITFLGNRRFKCVFVKDDKSWTCFPLRKSLPTSQARQSLMFQDTWSRTDTKPSYPVSSHADVSVKSFFPPSTCGWHGCWLTAQTQKPGWCWRAQKRKQVQTATSTPTTSGSVSHLNSFTFFCYIMFENLKWKHRQHFFLIRLNQCFGLDYADRITGLQTPGAEVFKVQLLQNKNPTIKIW